MVVNLFVRVGRRKRQVNIFHKVGQRVIRRWAVMVPLIFMKFPFTRPVLRLISMLNGRTPVKITRFGGGWRCCRTPRRCCRRGGRTIMVLVIRTLAMLTLLLIKVLMRRGRTPCLTLIVRPLRLIIALVVRIILMLLPWISRITRNIRLRTRLRSIVLRVLVPGIGLVMMIVVLSWIPLMRRRFVVVIPLLRNFLLLLLPRGKSLFIRRRGPLMRQILLNRLLKGSIFMGRVTVILTFLLFLTNLLLLILMVTFGRLISRLIVVSIKSVLTRVVIKSRVILIFCQSR